MSTTALPRDAVPLAKRAPVKPARRRLLAWGAAALVIVGAAFGTLRIARHPATAAAHFQTAAIDHGPISAKVTATGKVSALVTVSVGAQVSGRISSLGADFESPVKAGQTIATIEPSLFRAAVAQARANHDAAVAARAKAEAGLDNASKQLARAQSLRAQNLLAGADYDVIVSQEAAARADVVASTATVSQAKAALDQALLNLHYTTIVSPIDGVVISRNVDVGQTVASALQAPTLFLIAQDLTRMQVDTDVAEADVGKVRAEMPVSFTVDAYPARTFAGRIRQVRNNAQTTQNVVTYDAVVDVDNSERLLKPGMTASVTFVYSEKADVLRIPNAALRFRPDSATQTALSKSTPPQAARADERVVWIAHGPGATPVLVRVGITDGVSTEIVEGDVHAGDSAVVEAAPEAGKKS